MSTTANGYRVEQPQRRQGVTTGERGLLGRLVTQAGSRRIQDFE